MNRFRTSMVASVLCAAIAMNTGEAAVTIRPLSLRAQGLHCAASFLHEAVVPAATQSDHPVTGPETRVEIIQETPIVVLPSLSEIMQSVPDRRTFMLAFGSVTSFVAAVIASFFPIRATAAPRISELLRQLRDNPPGSRTYTEAERQLLSLLRLRTNDFDGSVEFGAACEGHEAACANWLQQVDPSDDDLRFIQDAAVTLLWDTEDSQIRIAVLRGLFSRISKRLSIGPSSDQSAVPKHLYNGILSSPARQKFNEKTRSKFIADRRPIDQAVVDVVEHMSDDIRELSSAAGPLLDGMRSLALEALKAKKGKAVSPMRRSTQKGSLRIDLSEVQRRWRLFQLLVYVTWSRVRWADVWKHLNEERRHDRNYIHWLNRDLKAVVRAIIRIENEIVTLILLEGSVVDGQDEDGARRQHASKFVDSELRIERALDRYADLGLSYVPLYALFESNLIKEFEAYLIKYSHYERRIGELWRSIANAPERPRPPIAKRIIITPRVDERGLQSSVLTYIAASRLEEPERRSLGRGLGQEWDSVAGDARWLDDLVFALDRSPQQSGSVASNWWLEQHQLAQVRFVHDGRHVEAVVRWGATHSTIRVIALRPQQKDIHPELGADALAAAFEEALGDSTVQRITLAQLDPVIFAQIPDWLTEHVWVEGESAVFTRDQAQALVDFVKERKNTDSQGGFKLTTGIAIAFLISGSLLLISPTAIIGLAVVSPFPPLFRFFERWRALTPLQALVRAAA